MGLEGGVDWARGTPPDASAFGDASSERGGGQDPQCRQTSGGARAGPLQSEELLSLHICPPFEYYFIFLNFLMLGA